MVDVRKLLQEKTVCVGRDLCLKKLRSGEATQVYVASNCPDLLELQHLAELHNASVEQLDVTNKELGALCRKPFSVSAICVV